MTLAAADAARLGVGLSAVCANVVQSLNAILNRAYKDHTPRGGGGMPGATALHQQGSWSCMLGGGGFEKFDLSLQHHGAPHTAGVLWRNSWPPEAPVVHLLFATPNSCFTTTWTEKC